VTKPSDDGANAGTNAGPKRRGAPPFVKGKSGNPAGKKKGTKHRRTLLLAAMTADDHAAIVEKIIRQAKRGCRPSQRLIVDRTEPPRRGSPVKFPLPPIKTAGDIVSALAAVAAAMAVGKISTAEALEVAGVIELSRRAIETQEIETGMQELEGKFK
jgi:hypothetical protein